MFVFLALLIMIAAPVWVTNYMAWVQDCKDFCTRHNWFKFLVYHSTFFSPMECKFCLKIFFVCFKLFILYWTIANEQCFDSFRWTAKGLSLTYIYIYIHIYIHVSILPQSPLHPDCHIALSCVPCTVQLVLVGCAF